jgi:hypothetical protein
MKRDGDPLRFVCKQVHHEVRPYANSCQNLTRDTSLYTLTCTDGSVHRDRSLVRSIEITGKGVPKILAASLIKKIRTSFPEAFSIVFQGTEQE